MSEIIKWITEGLSTPLFSFSGENITVVWIIQILALLIIISFVARSSKRFLKRQLLVSLGISEGNREVIATLASFALATFGYILVLQGMGLDLASIAVIVGGLGVGIGFGLQDLTKNLVSGITLLGEQKLKVGDLVEFDGILGHIQEVSIRATVIRTFQGSEVIVPNTRLTDNKVENWSYENCHGRIVVAIEVEYKTDTLVVTEILLQAASLEPQVLLSPPPQVIFEGFGENGFKFQLWAWVGRIDRSLVIKSSLNFLVEYQLRQHNINIANPQRDLWLRNSHEIAAVIRPPKTVPPSTPSSISTLKKLLPNFSYFKNLSEIELRRVIEMGTRRHLQPQEIVFNQGEYTDSFCVVLEGGVDAIYQNDKISRRLFTFSAGQYFGEVPLILKIPYPTTIIATTETILFIFHYDGFQYLLTRYPELSEEITQELAKRQEVIEAYHQKLKEMGLSQDNDTPNVLNWIRDRLKKMFVV